MKITYVVALVVLAASSASAQLAPAGWRPTLDKPAENVLTRDVPAGAWQFQEMVPGMHVTSGPGVTLRAPGSASGRYMIDATIVLFPNSSDNGYGVLFGADSAGESPSWQALLVDASGRWSVVQHTSAGRKALVPPTAHDAILRRGKETVTNQLRVSVERDSIRFFANTQRLGAMARTDVRPDGAFGLRLDAGNNTHVTNVDLTQRLLKR